MASTLGANLDGAWTCWQRRNERVMWRWRGWSSRSEVRQLQQPSMQTQMRLLSWDWYEANLLYSWECDG